MAALAGCGLSGVAALVVDGPRAVASGVGAIVKAFEGEEGSGEGDGGDGAGGGGGRDETAPTIDDTIFNLSEGATAIGTVTATDEDSKDSISYSFEDGTQVCETPDGVNFNIDAETGEITSTTPLDYESSTSHSFVVVATDLGGNTNTETVTVNLSDVWEPLKPIELSEVKLDADRLCPRLKPLAELKARADEGDAEAMYRYGSRLRGLEETWRWHCRAAHKGHAKAQYSLATYYGSGLRPAQKDIIKSYLWRSLSLNGGDPRAASAREQTAQKMTADQIAEAESLLADWKPNPAECKREAKLAAE
jgi:hypothetical protein